MKSSNTKHFLSALPGTIALGIILGGGLAGCSLSPNSNAGIVTAEIDCEPAKGVKGGKICDAKLVSGREQDSVSLTFNPDTGEVKYRARGVKAFEGQIARGLVERAIVEAAAKAGTDIAPALLKAVVDAIALP